jgi:ABC-type transport system, involved in lipoprotein release, permease component
VIRNFEFFVAQRYLRAKRKQAVISVITLISIVGVAAGVMALVVSLAINNGFRNTLQRNLLGATAHVSILEKEPEYGIQNWREVSERVKKLPHVVSATPSLYGGVMFSGPLQATGGILKGVDPATAGEQTDILKHLKAGSLAGLAEHDGLPGIVLGSRLAQGTGMVLGSVVRVISPQGELTPFGPHVTSFTFRVVGIFESGFGELDATWAYTSVRSAQRVLSLEDVVNVIEVKTDDADKAGDVAKSIDAVAGLSWPPPVGRSRTGLS